MQATENENSFNLSDTEMFETFQHLVNKIIIRHAKNPSDADDIFQEVFVTYMIKRPVFKDEDHAKYWFIAVTIRTVLGWNHRNAHTLSLDLLSGAGNGLSSSAGYPLDAKSSCENNDMISLVEDQIDLQKLISILPKDQHTVFTMHFDTGLTFDEISTRLKITPSKAKQLWASATRRIRSELLNKKEGG